jgi:hypothetical protein
MTKLIVVFRNFVNALEKCKWSRDTKVIYLKNSFFFNGATAPLMGQGPLVFEALRSHSDTSHSAGRLWTSDQSDAGTTA